MSERESDKPEDTGRRKKFPIRCIKCGKVEVRPAVIPYEIEKNHDGKLYKLSIPDLHVNRCDNCGELYFANDAHDQIAAALRQHLRLLTPEQIRANIEALGITQKELADRIGVAPETVSRWLSGAMIQSRAMDNLLRVFFACPDVRDALSGEPQDPELGIKTPREAGSRGDDPVKGLLLQVLRSWRRKERKLPVQLWQSLPENRRLLSRRLLSDALIVSFSAEERELDKFARLLKARTRSLQGRYPTTTIHCFVINPVYPAVLQESRFEHFIQNVASLPVNKQPRVLEQCEHLVQLVGDVPDEPP